jgi:restriction endonuclease
MTPRTDKEIIEGAFARLNEDAQMWRKGAVVSQQQKNSAVEDRQIMERQRNEACDERDAAEARAEALRTLLKEALQVLPARGNLRRRIIQTIDASQ